MKRDNLTKILPLDVPIVQAGMAGGATTPELVAAVSNAGGLGTLGAGYLTAESLRDSIKKIKSLTARPFAVNLFVPEKEHEIDLAKIDEMKQILKPYREKLQIKQENLTKFSVSFAEQIAVIFEEKVPVFSFTFGIPSKELIASFKDKGVLVIGTATSVQEAISLETFGVDAIVAQGSEAGGHRATFIGPAKESMVGTMALVPQIVDSVSLPVIASGGIMDGRGIVASLALGASAVQMGTVFLASFESGAHILHKKALVESSEQSTDMTTVFSGKYARGIRNTFMEEMEQYKDHILPYPIQNALTKDIRGAAAYQGVEEYMSLWAGQASGLSKEKAVAEIMEDLKQEIKSVSMGLQE